MVPRPPTRFLLHSSDVVLGTPAPITFANVRPADRLWSLVLWTTTVPEAGIVVAKMPDGSSVDLYRPTVEKVPGLPAVELGETFTLSADYTGKVPAGLAKGRPYRFAVVFFDPKAQAS